MELNTLFFALAIPAVIFAGISKGGFGSGASFVSAPIMAMIVDPGIAVGLMLPLLMLMDVSAIRPYWKQWSDIDVKRLIIGSLPGVAIGAFVFRWANDDILRLLIGVIALAFIVWQIAAKAGVFSRRTEPFAPWVGVLTGGIGGFTSFVSHAGGPPVAIYLLAQGLGKTTYQATTVLTFWAINIFKAVPYAFLGLFTVETLTANLILAPFAILGTWLGVRAHRLVPEPLFFAITYVLLAITGTKLIWDALT